MYVALYLYDWPDAFTSAICMDYNLVPASRQESAFATLRNTGLLARLESVNAVVEPTGRGLLVSIPGHEQMSLAYDSDKFVDVIEATLNSDVPIRSIDRKCR